MKFLATSSDYLRRIGPAFLIALILSSCSATDRRLTNAAAEQGRLHAGINLPSLPDDCRIKEPHAPLGEGIEVRSTLVRERAALNRQNTRTDRCASFYDVTRSRFAGS